jgi:hypothetical protein
MGRVHGAVPGEGASAPLGLGQLDPDPEVRESRGGSGQRTAALDDERAA